MSLFRKVRVLAGALLHRPFAPRRKAGDLGPGPAKPGSSDIRPVARTQVAQEMEEERVADLIAEKRTDETTQAR